MTEHNHQHKHFLIFFFDDLHQGAMNHIIHFVGCGLAGYGLGKMNWWLVIISPFIMEAGHLYNYIRGTHREHAIRIIPLQLLVWVVFVSVGWLLSLIV